jgi:hypothetical protein
MAVWSVVEVVTVSAALAEGAAVAPVAAGPVAVFGAVT